MQLVSVAPAKAAFFYLIEKKGEAVADQWLRALKLTEADLEDETRTIPLTTLHAGLVDLVRLESRDAIPQLWRPLIAHDNLGFWVRAIRGAQSPAEAFARLDSSESEYARTTRWETLHSGTGHWIGRAILLHDATLEEGGLLSLLRAAELRAVPALFGHPEASVAARAATAAPTELTQTYEVRWRVLSARTVGLVAAIVGAIVGALIATASPTSLSLIVGGVMGATAAGAAAGTWVREQNRRAEAAAQMFRVQALERSLALKERAERLATGQLEGTIVAGHYRIVRRMGSGASGVIYEALNLRDSKPVAVKLLRAAAAHDVAASDRLRREAEALRLSWHPNVVEMIDQGHLPDGTSYLVMELLRGDSLAVRIRSNNRLRPDEVLPLALTVCDALGAVHAAGVVHRDLKPSNIILARVPEGERVKIIDFGIARVEWEETRITNMGAPVGTPGYMAPEQESGKDVDSRADLFALGSIIYECLVGEPPPPLSSGRWAAHGRTNETPVMRDIPAPWRPVIAKATAPSADDRYQDARSFAQALREIQPSKAAP